MLSKDFFGFLRYIDQKHMKPSMQKITTQILMPITIHSLRPNGGVLDDSSARRLSPVGIFISEQPAHQDQQCNASLAIIPLDVMQ
jgi:hypothetical protein